jgi:phage terminase large subunit-like protein
MVMPNLGRSVQLDSLIADWQTEQTKNDAAIRIWASQHLNIEMGIGLQTDGWTGAEFWASAVDDTLTLDSLIDRSETVVVGVDGGGLDDLFGLAILGREKETKRWLSWSHAWCHRGVLQRRLTIASRLEDFAAAGELTIVDDKLEDVSEIVGIVQRVNDAGVLSCVALDVEGPYGEFVDALAEIDVTEEAEKIVGIGQGYKLMGAIKTVERKLANGTMVHARSTLMDWCCTNVKIEPTATAIRPTKQNAGDAKIDAWCALMDAATVMVKHPDRAPTYQMMFV